MSLTPTAHRFTVGGRLLYMRCAWDLATLGAAEQWLSQHLAGTVLDLDDAYELGRKATRCCMG